MSGNETPTRGHIQINNVSKIYDPDGAKVLAVDRCTMDIAPGEFCVVVGPSGCGKTTLLNAIAGFHSISSGEILLDGEVLCSADKQAQPGSDRIVVFQNGALFPWFTVLENVTFGPIVQKAMSKEEAEGKAMEMLGQMGLMGIENNYPSEISSGMRRRVEIARAMMNNPRVLLLDEPFRAMDALTKTVVHQFLLQVYDRSKTTVFFITHDLEEAIFLGSKVYIMTTRPATIKKILDVDIPRPRDFRVLSSPTYTRLKEECISAVHEEALIQGRRTGNVTEGDTMSSIKKSLCSATARRGIISIIVFTVVWEICTRLHVPIIGNVPAPSSVIGSMGKQLTDAFYWISWRDSMMRIVGGFVLAQVIGIPLGLLLGASKAAHNLIYPVFEIMRPVPPLAWVPVAVIFWPTPEMSMVFVTFLGAFFIVVINIVDGVRSIDARYLRAARSLGSSRSDMFWHILLPGSLPSIVVGMTVGMGVTWAVVVAAEMIASRTGLGYLTWSAYVAGEFPVIIIGMMSIGIAGYVCSAIIRFAGTRMTPWLRTF